MGVSGSKSIPFDVKTDIPSLKDKVILVTGGSSGLGKQSVLDLAKHEPKQIWLGARNATKAQAAIDEIKAEVPDANIKFLEIDLESFASVRNAAKTLLTDGPDRLDILLLNAGIMAMPASTTKEGYELQFGTNHMGHALLTKLLLEPLLLKTASQHGTARVVVLSSAGHAMAPTGGIAFDSLKTTGESMNTWYRYGQSKLANVLFAKELARRYPALTVASVHPGVIKTNLGTPFQSTGSWIMTSIVAVFSMIASVDIATGTKNQLWAATSEHVVSGTYYAPVGMTGKGSAETKDEALAEKLWEWTEKELEGQTSI